MIDSILKWVAIALLAVAVALGLCLAGGLIYIALDDAEYHCEKTGRQVLVMMPVGKVMVPIMQDETKCTRIEK